MKFRKKAVVIEAWQVGSKMPMPKWLLEAIEKREVTRDGTAGIYVATLEGIMLAKPGDYIIQGIKGELYPCKPDIFAATYEAA